MSDNDERKLGPCTRIRDVQKELLCSRPAIEEVLVRNRFGLYAVALCKECKEEHYKYYKRLRESREQSSQASDVRRLSHTRGNDDRTRRS